MMTKKKGESSALTIASDNNNEQQTNNNHQTSTLETVPTGLMPISDLEKFSKQALDYLSDPHNPKTICPQITTLKNSFFKLPIEAVTISPPTASTDSNKNDSEIAINNNNEFEFESVFSFSI